MAPHKHQGVPAGGLVLLVALLVLGLSLPGAAAQQQDEELLSKHCRRNPFGLPSPDDHLRRCAFKGKDTIKDCCGTLKFWAPTATDCTCAVLKVIEGKGIDINNVCGTSAIAKPCEDKADAARKAQEKKAEEERAAKEREDRLSALDSCDRLFERLGGGDTSKITLEDARGCLQTMKTCAASCQKQ